MNFSENNKYAIKNKNFIKKNKKYGTHGQSLKWPSN